MGKATIQRQLRRMKYLAKLAKTDPDGFDREWEKRLSSWLDRIRADAGRLKRETGRGGDLPVDAVFAWVDLAMEALKYCGKEVYEQYAEETYDLLAGECCRHFATNVDKNLYRLNNYKEAA